MSKPKCCSEKEDALARLALLEESLKDMRKVYVHLLLELESKDKIIAEQTHMIESKIFKLYQM